MIACSRAARCRSRRGNRIDLHATGAGVKPGGSVAEFVGLLHREARMVGLHAARLVLKGVYPVLDGGQRAAKGRGERGRHRDGPWRRRSR